MSTTYKIILTCKDATFLSSQKEEGKLSFGTQLKMMIHLMGCPPCRRFIAQSKLIFKSAHHYKDSLLSNHLSTDKKQSIQDTINELASREL